MASAQHAAQHPRYPLNTYSNSDSLRLPSLKDLNFYRPPPGDPNAPPNDFVQNDVARHVQWSRPGQSAPMQPGMPPHSQHAQPQSQPQPQQHSPNSRDMGHQPVEYSKHDAVYARPGMPLSAQVAPVLGSVSSGPPARGDDPPPQSPHQPRRPRPPPANINAARDGRPSHTAYPAQYNGYPSNQPPSSSPYHQMPSQNHSPHSAAPSQPEQLNHNAPASSHPNYNGYSQQHYVQTRQPGHPSHAPQHPQAYHQQSLQHQNTSHPTPPSHHALHVHPSQQQQQQQQQHQHQHQHQQQQQQQPTASSNPPSVHPSSLLQPPHPSQQAPHHTSQHQSSSGSHQPQQQQLPNHAPHGNPYPSPNSSVHPPQSPWPPSSHSQPPHHQPPPAPSHAQQTQQALSQSVHHHHPPPPVSSHHHHQTNALPPSTPQTIIQSQHQHAPPPQSLPPSQTQHHPPQHSQAQAPNPHHASQPQLPQSQPHPPPQQQQLPFTRTAPLVPTNLESRNAHYPPAASSAPEVKHVPDHSDPMNEQIVEHCNSLCLFAQHYVAAAQQSMQPPQPSPAELQDMSQKALQVVRLLEEFKRAHVPDSERNKLGDSMYEASEDHRAPKRPWEDMVQGGNNADSPEGQYALGADKGQTTAEQDMEMIRSKRASSTAGANTTAGQTKSKYRKRSRATPPGKCHSCNIRETPEWRRGPDGARTLCNACGLHYAKLMRKRDKTDPTGQTPRIDLETLRASARAAESSDKSRSKNKNAAEPSSPTDSKSSSQQHHQGSFQLMNVMAQEPNSSSESNRTIPPPQASQPPPPVAQSAPSTIPVPPWSTPVQHSQPPSSVAGPPPVHGRGYPEHLQHQSFMRSSQHSSVPQASSR
ncbi:hypothetical protein AGABI1DRAFT_114240 [Agaricus bisporus var. burnettii JB137-S8]|uniref:GATA-type domain-containing protein n=1 Tax=Agaricus bisporus var. burnettii (strain JB137-S8 / ATCC MYA-4627 / FGSC 10392) TaxID=597362 RepID=K5VVZ7_AGABU|nr:uncharacterized protein AGABI1DRAFT_114240 [Agaricus bisporus var. burnettii JB137-S8]EKM78624.1 hypothetical protein AGABI1DRAFT_114240 [Agaricus bisporus var. burnettii JB137-S8]